MSIQGAIEVGEKAVKDLAVKKETARVEALSPEDKKAEEAKQAEIKQAEADKAILEAKDETLDEAGRAKKSMILKAQEKSKADNEKRILEAKDADLTDEERETKLELFGKKREADKKAEIQKEIDDRIGEVTGKLKAETAKREKLEAEIAELRNKSEKDPGKVEVELEKLEQTRVAKNLAADASLPREKRREMSDEDLQEWLVEDMVQAQRWLAKQEVRKDRERAADEAKLNGGDGDGMNKKAEAVIQKQKESNARVFAKHPELDVTRRVNAMKAEGKSAAEIGEAIKNDPKCKLALEIIQENQDKYLLAENGPELVAAEMEKRMKSNHKGETQEERDKRIADEAVEAERQRLASIDEGVNSTRGKGQDVKMGDLEKQQWTLFQKNFPNKTLADFRAMQKRRKENAGA